MCSTHKLQNTKPHTQTHPLALKNIHDEEDNEKSRNYHEYPINSSVLHINIPWKRFAVVHKGPKRHKKSTQPSNKTFCVVLNTLNLASNHHKWMRNHWGRWIFRQYKHTHTHPKCDDGHGLFIQFFRIIMQGWWFQPSHFDLTDVNKRLLMTQKWTSRE